MAKIWLTRAELRQLMREDLSGNWDDQIPDEKAPPAKKKQAPRNAGDYSNLSSDLDAPAPGQKPQKAPAGDYSNLTSDLQASALGSPAPKKKLQSFQMPQPKADINGNWADQVPDQPQTNSSRPQPAPPSKRQPTDQQPPKSLDQTNAQGAPSDGVQGAPNLVEPQQPANPPGAQAAPKGTQQPGNPPAQGQQPSTPAAPQQPVDQSNVGTQQIRVNRSRVPVVRRGGDRSRPVYDQRPRAYTRQELQQGDDIDQQQQEQPQQPGVMDRVRNMFGSKGQQDFKEPPQKWSPEKKKEYHQKRASDLQRAAQQHQEALKGLE